MISEKNKKGEITIGHVFLLFIGIIVGIIFIGVIVNSAAPMNTKQTSTNESSNLSALGCYITTAQGEVQTNDTRCNITLTSNPPRYNFNGNCPNSGLTIKNTSGFSYVANTDYIFYSNIGVIDLQNTTATNRSSGAEQLFASYTFCPYGYNVDSGSRSIIPLIGLFSAFALLAFVLYYAWKEGMLDTLLGKVGK